MFIYGIHPEYGSCPVTIFTNSKMSVVIIKFLLDYRMHEYYSYRVNQLSLVTEVYLDRYTLYRVQAAASWKY